MPLTVTGDGQQSRDFTHVADIVEAFKLAAHSDLVGNGETINAGAGSPVTIDYLAKLFGGPIEYIPPRLEPRCTHADTTKASKLLGWQPQIAIEEGIAELLQQIS